jgi:hypothetical protein
MYYLSYASGKNKPPSKWRQFLIFSNEWESFGRSWASAPQSLSMGPARAFAAHSGDHRSGLSRKAKAGLMRPFHSGVRRTSGMRPCRLPILRVTRSTDCASARESLTTRDSGVRVRIATRLFVLPRLTELRQRLVVLTFEVSQRPSALRQH